MTSELNTLIRLIFLTGNYIEQAKIFVFSFVFVFVLAHEQSINAWAYFCSKNYDLLAKCELVIFSPP